jgi:Nuclease-related domain
LLRSRLALVALAVAAFLLSNDPAVRRKLAVLAGNPHVSWLGHIGPTQLIAVLVVAALAIGFALGRFQTYAQTRVFQNRGEARLSRALTVRFAGPDYHLLNHVTLRLGNETTQIDHVLVSRFGVFVIETKDYKGWIFGSPDDRYWTQVFRRAKFRFQNPIRQNYKHARAIQDLMEFLPADVIRPVVVFTGNAEFKTSVPDGVFTLAGFLAYVERQAAEVISINRVQFCVGRLETARLSITKETDIEHVQGLRRRYGSKDE